jgi:hypothetical protein
MVGEAVAATFRTEDGDIGRQEHDRHSYDAQQ